MKKIWQKTEGSEINALIEDYTVGVDYLLDMELIPYDVQGSSAHVKMLHKIWVLTTEEKDTLLQGLQQILELHKNNNFSIEKHQEDGHTAIEAYLIENCGEVWKKIHTARSRNDQILVTTRLFTLDKLEGLIKALEKLIFSLKKVMFP